MSATDAKTRRCIARIAALSRWAKLTPEQRREATRPAREAFLGQFEEAPNPEAAKSVHFMRMSHTSAKKRGHKARRRKRREARRRDAYEQARADGDHHDQAEEIAEEVTWEETVDATR